MSHPDPLTTPLKSVDRVTSRSNASISLSMLGTPGKTSNNTSSARPPESTQDLRAAFDTLVDNEFYPQGSEGKAQGSHWNDRVRSPLGVAATPRSVSQSGAKSSYASMASVPRSATESNIGISPRPLNLSSPPPFASPLSSPSASVALPVDPFPEHLRKLFESLCIQPYSSTDNDSSTSNASAVSDSAVILTEPCVRRGELLSYLVSRGILADDSRVRLTLDAIRCAPEFLTFSHFSKLLSADFLLRKIVMDDLIVPDFPAFTDALKDIFDEVHKDTSGDVATYIPQLASVNPEQFGVSVCTADGQRWNIGESDVHFCIQSCSKPITYASVLSQHGVRKVHSVIGREPSGRGFNERILNAEGLPHNPMINSGAIMSAALFHPGRPESERFELLMDLWRRLSANNMVMFDNSTYLSERATADRNYSLAYMMRESHMLPAGTKISETLEMYFMQCSIKLTTAMMSVVAATLANGGVNPLTHERVFEPSVVRHVLSLMSSCGMYDASGEFAFSVGFPTKSGVSGVIMMVVPGRMGLCSWSPRLDKIGNSVRGVAFCQQLMTKFDFHVYSDITFKHNLPFTEQTPTPSSSPAPSPSGALMPVAAAPVSAAAAAAQSLFTAVYANNIPLMRQCIARRVPLDSPSYDAMTPLHVACILGQVPMVAVLLSAGADAFAVDRTGRTAVDLAQAAALRIYAQALSQRTQVSARVASNSAGCLSPCIPTDPISLPVPLPAAPDATPPAAPQTWAELQRVIRPSDAAWSVCVAAGMVAAAQVRVARRGRRRSSLGVGFDFAGGAGAAGLPPPVLGQQRGGAGAGSGIAATATGASADVADAEASPCEPTIPASLLEPLPPPAEQQQQQGDGERDGDESKAQPQPQSTVIVPIQPPNNNDNNNATSALRIAVASPPPAPRPIRADFDLRLAAGDLITPSAAPYVRVEMRVAAHGGDNDDDADLGSPEVDESPCLGAEVAEEQVKPGDALGAFSKPRRPHTHVPAALTWLVPAMRAFDLECLCSVDAFVLFQTVCEQGYYDPSLAHCRELHEHMIAAVDHFVMPVMSPAAAHHARTVDDATQTDTTSATVPTSSPAAPTASPGLSSPAPAQATPAAVAETLLPRYRQYKVVPRPETHVFMHPRHTSVDHTLATYTDVCASSASPSGDDTGFMSIVKPVVATRSAHMGQNRMQSTSTPGAAGAGDSEPPQNTDATEHASYVYFTPGYASPRISLSGFQGLLQRCPIIYAIIVGSLAIPDWGAFRRNVWLVYDQVRADSSALFLENKRVETEAALAAERAREMAVLRAAEAEVEADAAEDAAASAADERQLAIRAGIAAVTHGDADAASAAASAVAASSPALAGPDADADLGLQSLPPPSALQLPDSISSGANPAPGASTAALNAARRLKSSASHLRIEHTGDGSRTPVFLPRHADPGSMHGYGVGQGIHSQAHSPTMTAMQVHSHGLAQDHWSGHAHVGPGGGAGAGAGTDAEMGIGMGMGAGMGVGMGLSPSLPPLQLADLALGASAIAGEAGIGPGALGSPLPASQHHPHVHPPQFRSVHSLNDVDESDMLLISPHKKPPAPASHSHAHGTTAPGSSAAPASASAASVNASTGAGVVTSTGRSLMGSPSSPHLAKALGINNASDGPEMRNLGTVGAGLSDMMTPAKAAQTQGALPRLPLTQTSSARARARAHLGGADPSVHTPGAATPGAAAGLSMGTGMGVGGMGSHHLPAVLPAAASLPTASPYNLRLPGLSTAPRSHAAASEAETAPLPEEPSPPPFMVSVCSVTSQQVSFGPVASKFTVQSLCKIVNYLIVQELWGEEIVHQYIGKEPSGREVSELCLDYNNRPHNPYINAGAIMCCSLLSLLDTTMADTFALILGYWRKLTCSEVTYSVQAYSWEKDCCDRNYCLAFMMKDQRSFPARIRTHRDVYTLLDLYAWCTSIEVTTQQASLLAATLANGGVNPLTGAVVFHPKHVRNALSIMATAGMYNFSGEYAFHMGLPAKSSSTGTLLICVPNVMGICASCPMSDEHWIPVTATRFCFRLCRLYSLHVYEPHENRQKYNPKNPPDFNTHRIVALHFAAADNDIFTVLRKLMQGVDINARDALGRTALHVAVANGSSNVVAVLLRLNADITARDLEGRCVDGLLPGSPDRDREIQQQQPQQQQQQVVLSPHSPSPQQSGAESGAESEGEDVNRMTCVRLVREEWRRRQENQMWRQRLSVGRMDMTQHYYR